MPLFKFRCDDCGEVFEELVGAQDNAVVCPGCKTANVHRLMSLISSKGLTSDCASCEPSKCSSRFS